MSRAAALLCALCAGCGSAALPAHPRAAAPGEVPASDRDPLPYTPAPDVEGSTDRTVSLAVAGGEDQARQMLPLFLSALRDGDERQLGRLLAEEIIAWRRTDASARPRASAIQGVLVHARRSIIQPDVEVAELVDLSAVEVSRVGREWQARVIPPGLRATDLVVRVPLHDAGRLPLRTMLAWDASGGQLVVRPGPDPRIVAW